MNTTLVKTAMQNAIAMAQEEVSERSMGILEGIVIACEVETGKPIEPLKDIWIKAMDVGSTMFHKSLCKGD